MPCIAESSDIRIPIQASISAQVYICLDDNLLATYVDDNSSPPKIKVFYADSTLYRSIPLSNVTSEIESLQISDNRLYYTEYDKSITRTSRTKAVYKYDMATDEKIIIYTAGFYNNIESRITGIAADGDYVVLRENCGGDDLILHTLSTGTNQIIFRSKDMIHGLSIDGDRIMWGCERIDREPGREIHIYTISTSEDYIIPESKSIKTWGYGDISKDMVVWIQAAEEPDTSLGYPSLTTTGGDIRLTYLSTEKTNSVEIINAPSFPYISEDMIVYVKKPDIDYNNTDTGTIRTYDIRTGTFSDVGSDVAGINDFDNGLVVWHRYSPRADWLTSISGIIPTFTQIDTQNTNDVPQSTPAQESPTHPVTIISALVTGIAGYTAISRR